MGDTEAGALVVDRPVASSLAHELLHVMTGVDDNRDEKPLDTRPVALPTGAAPGCSDPTCAGSVLNSFPFFRNLSVGNATLAACEPPVPISSTEELCERALGGFNCTIDLDFTD